MKAAMKCFGAYQDVPGHTGATLPSPGAARGVPPGAAGGALLTAANTSWSAQGRGGTSEVNSDLCNRQAPVLSFHAEEHQELHIFQVGFVALQQGEAGGVDPEEGGCVLPWAGDTWGLPVAARHHRMITGSCRTGQRYPQLSKA